MIVPIGSLANPLSGHMGWECGWIILGSRPISSDASRHCCCPIVIAVIAVASSGYVNIPTTI